MSVRWYDSLACKSDDHGSSRHTTLCANVMVNMSVDQLDWSFSLTQRSEQSTFSSLVAKRIGFIPYHGIAHHQFAMTMTFSPFTSFGLAPTVVLNCHLVLLKWRQPTCSWNDESWWWNNSRWHESMRSSSPNKNGQRSTDLILPPPPNTLAHSNSKRGTGTRKKRKTNDDAFINCSFPHVHYVTMNTMICAIYKPCFSLFLLNDVWRSQNFSVLGTDGLNLQIRSPQSVQFDCFW